MIVFEKFTENSHKVDTYLNSDSKKYSINAWIYLLENDVASDASIIDTPTAYPVSLRCAAYAILVWIYKVINTDGLFILD